MVRDWLAFAIALLYNLDVGDVTRILDRVEQGDPKASGELLPLVYEELRRLAAAKMAQEKPGQTLQATAREMVHQAEKLLREALPVLESGTNTPPYHLACVRSRYGSALCAVAVIRVNIRVSPGHAASIWNQLFPFTMQMSPLPSALDDQKFRTRRLFERFSGGDLHLSNPGFPGS